MLQVNINVNLSDNHYSVKFSGPEGNLIISTIQQEFPHGLFCDSNNTQAIFSTDNIADFKQCLDYLITRVFEDIKVTFKFPSNLQAAITEAKDELLDHCDTISQISFESEKLELEGTDIKDIDGAIAIILEEVFPTLELSENFDNEINEDDDNEEGSYSGYTAPAA